MRKVHDDAESRKVIRARGRLAEARKWFAHRGWDVLPQGIRGQRILLWGADQAYLAGPANPLKSVRRWCRCWAPWLKPAELDAIVAGTTSSNKRWSDDESAATLEINVADRQRLHLRFIGADNDPNFEIRDGLQREKNAGYSRTYRAKRSTGRPRGRPKSDGVPAWVAAGASSERSYYRHKARGTAAAQSGSKNPSGLLSKNRSPDAISLPPVSPVAPASMRGAHQASPRQHEAVEIGDAPVALDARPAPAPTRPIVIRLDAAPDGFIIDEDGHEFEPPPPYERRPTPKTWREAAFQGYRGERS
jgi:hypothetical protein